ncbi:MAG: hypothetical protein ABI345_04770 [Jatrophihabitans sp.]
MITTRPARLKLRWALGLFGGIALLQAALLLALNGLVSTGASDKQHSALAFVLGAVGCLLVGGAAIVFAERLRRAARREGFWEAPGVTPRYVPSARGHANYASGGLGLAHTPKMTFGVLAFVAFGMLNAGFLMLIGAFHTPRTNPAAIGLYLVLGAVFAVLALRYRRRRIDDDSWGNYSTPIEGVDDDQVGQSR